MNTVVVQAHPLDDSYSVALLEATLKGLRAKAVEPSVIRISEGSVLDESAVRAAEHLVVVYPTWWGSTPAMLLGPLVDLLGPWVDDARELATSPLRTVQRLTVVTSHGSSRWVNQLQGEPGRRLWARTVLGLCADSASFEWVSLYKIDRLDLAARTQFLDHVVERLAS